MKKFIVFIITAIILAVATTSCDSNERSIKQIRNYCETDILKPSLKSPNSYKKIGWETVMCGTTKTEFHNRIRQAEQRRDKAKLLGDKYDVVRWEGAIELMQNEMADSSHFECFSVERLRYLAKNSFNAEIVGTFDVLILFGEKEKNYKPYNRILAYKFDEGEWEYVKPTYFRIIAEVYDKYYDFVTEY